MSTKDVIAANLRTLRKVRGLSQPELAAKVTANFLDYHLLARRDRANIERLEDELGDGPLLLVPHFDDDVHDIVGLLRVHRYLFASDADRALLIDDVVA